MNQSLNSTCDGLFNDRSTQQKVIIVGRIGDDSDALLNNGLQRRGCQLIRVASCAGLDAAVLAQASLVFVCVSDLPSHALFAQIGAMLRVASHISVIPIVEYADQEKAAALLDAGCVDYLLSPFSEPQLQVLLNRQQSAKDAEEDFVSCSQAGRRLLAMAQRVASSRAPILITGETGTGKELMARYIHRFSAGKDAPFIAVNCAAIPEQMLESILFGHERGAFTGAATAQAGKFELANGGTLLLDEVGELPLGLQTNRDLQVEVAQGRFRADLMFRLDVLPLHITPLRERKDDVLPLTRRFIGKYAPQEQHSNLLTDDACRALLAHDWPGNVRELENILQRALVLRNGLFIQPQDLGLEAPALSAPQSESRRSLPPSAGDGKAALRASGKWAEYQHVIDTIRRFGGHKAKAAESLGMTPRALRYRLNAMREQGVLVTI
jgi:DNA-binding NtrC family response regulator